MIDSLDRSYLQFLHDKKGSECPQEQGKQKQSTQYLCVWQYSAGPMMPHLGHNIFCVGSGNPSGVGIGCGSEPKEQQIGRQ